MKKLLLTLSSTLQGGIRGGFLILALLATTSLWAYDFQSGDLYYNITSDSTVAVTYQYSSSNNYASIYTVTVPETVTYYGTTYSVTSIGNLAFSDCSSLTSITIPNSVTSIESSAFLYCRSLTSITIPNSVTSIGEGTFRSCSSLTSITIPNSVTSIGYGAFSGCDALPVENNLRYADTYLVEAVDETLSTYSIKEGTKWIGDYAFSGCSSLTSITIPNSVTSIGNYAFRGCSSLTSITIPNSVTSIGEEAFYGCSSLTSITIPNSVTSIGNFAFNGCSSLTSITIPNSVTSIGESAFAWCDALTSITIPNSVTSIGESAFAWCDALTSITIPNSVTSIGEEAFYGCSSLTSISIPESVTSVGNNAFFGCIFAKENFINNSVLNAEENNYWGARIVDTEIDGLFIRNDTVIDCRPNVTSVIIPEGVTTIGSSAFSGCSSLTSITIGNSVTSIGDWAFSGCSLTSITIGNSVTGIGNSAFYQCISLTSVTIPNSVTSIGESAFQNCFSLNSITIPNSITSIEKLVFGSCDSLTSITIPNSVTSIGEQAFYGCNTLTSITIPNSVTSIGERAFAVCPTLTSVTIPNSVTSIGERALSECYFLKTNFINNSSLNAEENNYWGATFVDQDIDGLLIRNDTVIKCRRLASSITIPNTITRIEDVAFAYCGNLTFVSIPNSVTSIGDDIFLSCRSLTSIVWDITEWTNPNPKPRSPFPTSLTSLTLGNHVEQIPAYFCYEMKNLSMINIPNVTKSIGESAFYGCESLTSVTIPNSVTSIGENAFAGCSKLQDVYCYAVEPPTAYDSSFSQYNAFLYILCENKKAYMLDEVFGNFKYIECISSDEVKTNDVVITPTTNDVTIIWPTEGNADSYTIVIKKDDEVFCTLTFNADGQLLNIAFAPGRDGNHPVQYAEQAGNGYRFTVTGLEESTHYTYNIDVRDAADKTIKSYTGEFTTESLTAVETITTNNANSHKIIRDNQLLILRDGKTYTIMGAEIH